MDDELKSLQAQLDSLKHEFAAKVDYIEKRVIAIQQQRTSATSFDPQPIPDQSIPTESTATQSEPPKSVATTENIDCPDAWTASSQPKHRVIRSFSFIKKGLFELLAFLLGPFAGIVEKLISVYKHHQSQGKVPVFFMSAAGISALILGFGFLMQYSFSQYLSETGKVLVGYVVAITITMGGIYFTRKHNAMAEYGSGIIGLGIILSYLCTYFISSYYSIIPTTFSFILLVIITACAYFIALLFETRIVAIVSVIGGAFVPVIIGQVEQPPHLYFAYLLVLTLAMLHLSQRIHWQTLAHTSMLSSVALIQYCLLDLPFMSQISWLLVALMHGFFYGFAYFAISDIARSKTVTKTTVVIVSANLIFILGTLEQVVNNAQTYGILLLLNAVVWVIIAMAPQKIFTAIKPKLEQETRKAIQAFALLSVGMLTGVGILVLTDPELMGLIWGIEGLILLYLGSRFGFFSVRIEAYFVLVIALVKACFDVVVWVTGSLQPTPVILDLEFGLGWLNLVVATTLIWGITFILNQHAQQQTKIDKSANIIGSEVLSIFLSASILLTIGIISSQWMWAFAAVPLFLLIFRAKRHSLKFTEYFGFAHYLLLLVPMVVSADQANSFRFTEQSMMGQVARVEAFVCLWGIAEFYRRVYPNGLLVQFAKILRQLFYCLIPVFFLPSILRRYAEFFPIVIWISSFISLFLYSQLKYKSLKIETLILVVLSSITAMVACGLIEFSGWNGYGASGLLLGVVFYGFVLWQWKGFERKPGGNKSFISVRKGVSPIFTLALYYLGLVLFIFVYTLTSLPELAAATTVLYFVAMITKQPAINPLRGNFSYLYFVSWAIILVLNLSIFNIAMAYSNEYNMHSIAVVIAMSCGAALVYLNRAQLTLVWHKFGGQLLHLWIFHLSIIVTYVSLIKIGLDQNVGPVTSIALVIHATVVLFQTLNDRFQRLIWIAISLFVIAAVKVILFDMSDFSLVEKIIAFMLIGALLLGAAYQYQKRRQLT